MLDTKEWIALIATIFSAVAAGASAYNTYLTNKKLEQDKSSFLGASLRQDEIEADWLAAPRDPGVPVARKTPLLKVINFGPSAATEVAISFTLTPDIPDFVGLTGSAKNQITARKAGDRFSADWFHTPGQGKSLSISQSKMIKKAFLASGEEIEVRVPLEIVNLMIVRAMLDGAVSDTSSPWTNRKKLDQSLDKPVLNVDITWTNTNGKPASATRRQFPFEVSKIYTGTGDGPQNALPDNFPANIIPEWDTLRFDAKLIGD